MEKKYQVSISSTYEDLKEERKKVQDTILGICKINALFAELSEMVLNLDYGEDEYSRDAIEKIKIYTYKFNQYSMKSNE